jgi:hypothetical protein
MFYLGKNAKSRYLKTDCQKGRMAVKIKTPSHNNTAEKKK